MKEAAGGVLGRTAPCDVPTGYASVALLPAALPDDLFDRPGYWRDERGRERRSLSHDSRRRTDRLLSPANDS